MPIENVAVWDFDGCLVDSSSRFRLGPDGKVDLPFWRKSETYSFLDPIIEENREKYQKQLACPKTHVIIATARVMRSHDLAMIDSKFGRPNALISRKGENDKRGGAELKIAGLKRLFNLQQYKGVKSYSITEDNLTYLDRIVRAFQHLNMRGIYYPSNQGF